MSEDATPQYDLGDRLAVRHHRDGLYLVHFTANGGESERIVVDGHIEILEHLKVDGDSYWHLKTEEERLLSFRGIKRELTEEGRVLDRRNLDDVLAAMLRAGPAARESHATFGVYSKDGSLEICTDPVPVKAEQEKAWEMIGALVDRGVVPEELEAYRSMLDFWHPWEVLPAFGLGIMAPFSLLLRERKILVPHLFNWAPEMDLGKSITAMIASDRLWGLEHISGPGLNSEFRLASQLDAICLPRAVEEAERLKASLWPTLKESAERRLADKRGTPDLGMVDYWSRSVLLLTGNSLPISTESVLKRFLVNRFDSGSRLERKSQSTEVDTSFNELQPIGFQLLRWAVEKWPTEEALLYVFKGFEDDIRKAESKWASPKRPQVWACVYLGLRIFEEGCRRTGVAWKVPPIEIFVKEIVTRVESATWQMRRSHVERFHSWLEMYMARNEITVREGEETRTVVRGEGKIFRPDTLEVKKERVPGYWVTSSLLDEYNRMADGEERIPTLAELAKQAADYRGLPYEDVLDMEEGKSPQARAVKIGGKSVRAAFVGGEYSGVQKSL